MFLWFIAGDSRLIVEWRDTISDPNNVVVLSAASVFEAIVRHAIGKVNGEDPPAT